ncbi:hypothetical protein [Thalassovita sp.]|uniref:hypothetical protein n=1 Tax=Thalassovita sp. TaxID=1979401 RepID=UPI0029DE848A|nr:hypothetical protein [Thalassovita sp.]
MRYLLCGVALIGLAACEPSIPDSGAGVGFGSYSDYQKDRAQRDASLAGQSLPAPMAVSQEQLAASRTGVSGTLPAATDKPKDEVERIAAETAAALNSGEKPVEASPSNPAPLQMNSPGISSENDFNRVSEQRTIEGDAERLAQNRAQYQVVAPTAVPTRTGGTEPNIVQYALTTRNAVGEAIYRRSGLSPAGRTQRNCAKYPSPDMAQTDFLKRGGPDRDWLGLDPDGDGFACDWDPRPFRKASGG